MLGLYITPTSTNIKNFWQFYPIQLKIQFSESANHSCLHFMKNCYFPHNFFHFYGLHFVLTLKNYLLKH